MTRVIAGVAGGRRLTVPGGRTTRPTSERAREGLFATVTSMRGSWAGARVLDLYAGSGAVGLEALSRGAAHALLVESDPRALRALRANVAALGLPGAEVVADRVERVLRRGPRTGRYNVVFADPPYALPDADVTELLAVLREAGWLASGAVIALERPSRGGAPRWPTGYTPDRARRYGEATLWYGHAQDH